MTALRKPHVSELILLLFVCVCAPARAAVVQGKDVTVVASPVPMTAFLRTGTAATGTMHFDAWEVRNNKTVLTYDVDMTKLMHMIVVSDDLTDFQHVHPLLLPNGHFVIDVRLKEAPAGYHVYLDGLPGGAGRHVFRFDLPGGAHDPPKRYLHSAGSTAKVGPYTVAIDPTAVPIGEISTISVRILKDGRPASDLHPYLGVMAHGVLIGTTDLAYMHVHGMTSEMLDTASGANDCGDSMMMQMTPMPPDLNIGNQFEFEILPPSEQDYDFWLQFVGGKTLFTAPLLVTTR